MKNLLANGSYIYKQTKIYLYCSKKNHHNNHNNYITWKTNETIN